MFNCSCLQNQLIDMRPVVNETRYYVGKKEQQSAD